MCRSLRAPTLEDTAGGAKLNGVDAFDLGYPNGQAPGKMALPTNAAISIDLSGGPIAPVTGQSSAFGAVRATEGRFTGEAV
jgi:hypothetical protein